MKKKNRIGPKILIDSLISIKTAVDRRRPIHGGLDLAEIKYFGFLAVLSGFGVRFNNIIS
jgi:hypothetical protein